MTAQRNAYNVTGTGQVYSGPCTFRGFWLFSVAGATVTIYDGVGATGTVLAAFVLGANQNAAIDLSDGVHCNNGVYVAAGAGVLVGSIGIG